MQLTDGHRNPSSDMGFKDTAWWALKFNKRSVGRGTEQKGSWGIRQKEKRACRGLEAEP